MFQNLSKAAGKVFVAASILALVVLPITAAGAATYGNADPNTLQISGSTTVAPIVQVALTRFPNTVAGAKFVFSQGGSGVGMTDIEKGVDDIGMSSSTCAEEAGQLFTCSQLVQTILARDAVSILINTSAPCNLTTMSKTTVQQIWTNVAGSITNWNQIPGCSVSAPLHIYAREIGSGTRSSLISLSGLVDANEQAKITASGTRENGSPAMEAAVQGDVDGIGYAGLHFIAGSDQAVSLSWVSYNSGSEPAACGADAVAPSDATVQNNCYPMSRNLYLFTLPTSANNKAVIQQFLTWILGPEGQAVVKDEGYLNVGSMASDSDVNLDGTVDISDVGVAGLDWNKTAAAAGAVPGWIRSDVNFDGVVDISDVGTIGLNWGATGLPH